MDKMLGVFWWLLPDAVPSGPRKGKKGKQEKFDVGGQVQVSLQHC